MNIFWVIVASVISGTLGSMGLGGGGILIIYLVLFAGIDQSTAQGMNLLFFIPISAIATLIYSKKGLIEWKLVFALCLTGFLGVFLGCSVSWIIDKNFLRKIFGIFLIIMSVKQFIKK